MLRGDSEEIDVFWRALMVAPGSCVPAPRYKLHVSEKKLKHIIAIRSYDGTKFAFLLYEARCPANNSEGVDPHHPCRAAARTSL